MVIKFILYVYIFICLFLAAAMDVKTLKINVLYLAISVIPLICFILAGGNSISWQDRVLGMAIGGVFIIVSLISGEAVGMGDGFVIAWTGMAVGGMSCIGIMAIALGLCFVTAVILSIKKSKRKIPFIPFIFSGFVISEIYSLSVRLGEL